MKSFTEWKAAADLDDYPEDQDSLMILYLKYLEACREYAAEINHLPEE